MNSDYDSVLGGLRDHGVRHVIVTGPQRSGTTFAAKILANDLHAKNVDEREINWVDLHKLHQLLSSRFRRHVIQCPCLSSMVHFISSPETAVVFMIRDLDDIYRSEKRVQWPHNRQEIRRYFRADGQSAEIKYDAWRQFQREKMKVPFFELEYESMKSHDLWINKEARSDFNSKQTGPSPAASSNQSPS